MAWTPQKSTSLAKNLHKKTFFSVCVHVKIGISMKSLKLVIFKITKILAIPPYHIIIDDFM
jgi:hypothetical protein